MLNRRLLDLLFPGDPGSSIPAGGSLEFAVQSLATLDRDAITAFEAALDAHARSRHATAFDALDDGDCASALESCRRAQPRLYTAYAVQAIRAYYSHARVQRAVGAGASPPFPQGNSLPEPDWTLLERVYLRGPIHREVPL